MNRNNPAIRRIMADVREMESQRTSRYTASPLEENMFEWHFTIRGPEGTDYAGGLYHGRILLPPEYPCKPPNFIFMNPNGRFEVGTKICLSISAHHEESWQAAWGVRTMLEAIISFLPSHGAGAIGAIEWPASERRKLAVESRSFRCPHCGPVADQLSEPGSCGSDDEAPKKEAAEDGDLACQIAQLTSGGAPAAEPARAPATPLTTSAASGSKETTTTPNSTSSATNARVRAMSESFQNNPAVTAAIAAADLRDAEASASGGAAIAESNVAVLDRNIDTTVERNDDVAIIAAEPEERAGPGRGPGEAGIADWPVLPKPGDVIDTALYGSLLLSGAAIFILFSSLLVNAIEDAKHS
eukprot:GSChrysophyteH1.ASY1.ANO1.1376.1 assembled CDS